WIKDGHAEPAEDLPTLATGSDRTLVTHINGARLQLKTGLIHFNSGVNRHMFRENVVRGLQMSRTLSKMVLPRSFEFLTEAFGFAPRATVHVPYTQRREVRPFPFFRKETRETPREGEKLVGGVIVREMPHTPHVPLFALFHGGKDSILAKMIERSGEDPVAF